MIEQNAARALIMYLQRALPVVPTTGIEWMNAQAAIEALEKIANGQLELEAKRSPQEQGQVPPEKTPHVVRS